jgi:D-3-phosphoglycerate dehydrogenase
MVNWRPLPRSVLAAAVRCRTVARYGTGLDNIDVAAATELGMVVSRVASYCADEVAEHATALLLALRRHVVPFTAQTRAGGWDNAAFGPMRRIRGSMLGIVGWGTIGRAVAQRGLGLGMQVTVFTRTDPPGGFPDGVRAAGSLLELAAAADHLSIHVPLTEQTRGMIDGTVLAAMGPEAVLINTSRGAVVSASDLIRAIRGGSIAGAALDVLDADPPAPGNPLIGLRNVLVTPHAAFNSVEALTELRRQAAANVVSALRGEVPAGIVNPEVLDAPELRLRQP